MTLGVGNVDQSRKNHHQGCFGTSLTYNIIGHNWPFLPQSAVLCKTIIGSRWVECDQYDSERLDNDRG